MTQMLPQRPVLGHWKARKVYQKGSDVGRKGVPQGHAQKDRSGEDSLWPDPRAPLTLW